VIVTALAGYVIGNTGYLLAGNLELLLLFRIAHGALTAGMFPAAMGVVSDVAGPRERGRYVGYVMAGFGVGFVFGPVIGGALYDAFGYSAPFLIALAVALVALAVSLLLLRETRTRRLIKRDRLKALRAQGNRCSLAVTMPRPVSTFALLILVSFSMPFAFTFVEPQMVFFFYGELGWNTLQFGAVVGVYGVALMATQITLGASSDRFPRRWVIAAGLVAAASLYLGLTFVTGFLVVLLIAALAGFGEGLATPAVNAFFLDITAPMHRARIMGMRSSAASMGAALGPLLTIGVVDEIAPAALFTAAAVYIVVIALIAAATLQPHPSPDVHRLGVDAEALQQRSLTAGATLRGLVIAASNSRHG